MLYAFLAMLLVASPVSAQGSPSYFLQPVEISVSPNFPAPGEIVTARVTSPSLELERSTIRWSVDGAPAVEGGDRFTFTIGEAGDATTVIVSVESDGVPYEASRTIRPASVDLVWDTSTYTPPLFPGKPLATPGSDVHIEAIPAFIGEEGRVPAESLIYTWYRNGALISGAAGRGRTSLTVPAPLLFATDVISVEVSTQDRAIAGEGSTRITSGDAVLSLYENHPIFGLRTNSALRRSTFADVEATVTAIPYFSAYLPRDARYIYEWSVNGQSIAADPNFPNSLTLNAESAPGDADVSLFLSHDDNIFFGARGQWSLNLRSGPDIRDPFFSPSADL